MTRSTPICFAALLATFAANALAAEGDSEGALLLASHGMSIDRIASIYTSEVGDDFGEPLSKAESDELWAINTVWQFQENMKGVLSSLGTSNNFFSYLGCYNETGKSGYERRLVLQQMFSDFQDRIYVSDDSVINVDERSCYLLSADLNVFWEVLGSQPAELTQFFELQPAGPSMKMLQGFYQGIHDRIMGEGDIRVPSNDGQIVITEDEEMAIDVRFCPIIKAIISNATEEDKQETYNDLLIDVMDFISEKDGKYLKDRDFFYHAYSTRATTLVSDRMKLWHDVVVNMTALTDADGFNKCFDYLIKEKMAVERTSDGTALVSFPLLDEVGSKDEECIFYLVRALANHPYVCRMDLVPLLLPLDQEEDTLSAAPWVRGAGGVSAVSSVVAGLALTALL